MVLNAQSHLSHAEIGDTAKKIVVIVTQIPNKIVSIV